MTDLIKQKEKQKEIEDVKKIISEYQNGNVVAFEDLVEYFISPLYSFCFRLIKNAEDTSDVVQEVWIKVWKNLKKFDVNASFKTWLFSIARNTAIDLFRKRKNITFSEIDEQYNADNDKISFEESIADTEPLADKLFEQKEASVVVQKALDELSFENRTIILLHDAEDMAFEEIAEIIEKPMNTVKSRYRRSLQVLRNYLENAPNM